MFLTGSLSPFLGKWKRTRYIQGKRGDERLPCWRYKNRLKMIVAQIGSDLTGRILILNLRSTERTRASLSCCNVTILKTRSKISYSIPADTTLRTTYMKLYERLQSQEVITDTFTTSWTLLALKMSDLPTLLRANVFWFNHITRVHHW